MFTWPKTLGVSDFNSDPGQVPEAEMKGSADDWTGMGLARSGPGISMLPQDHGETWRNMMNTKKNVSSGLGCIGIGSFIDSGKTLKQAPLFTAVVSERLEIHCACTPVTPGVPNNPKSAFVEK